MRILIKNKSKVIKFFFEETELNHKQLASKLGVSYWTLKNWLRRDTIPEKYFLELIKICPKISKLAIYEKLPSNWGAIKGGKNSFEKKSRQKAIQQAKIARTGRKYPLTLPLIDKDFCEFYGILLGDGCITKYFVKSEKRFRYCVAISGSSIDGMQYFREHLVPLINRLFNLSPSILYYSSSNGIRIDIKSRELANFLLEFGFPLGKKGAISIPNKILNSNNQNINSVVRGLLDTDGCIFARKDEFYKYPHIKITSYSEILCDQLVKILRKNGFRAYIHGHDVIIKGKENTEKWFNLIGSSHPEILKRYDNWKQTGKLLPKRARGLMEIE